MKINSFEIRKTTKDDLKQIYDCFKNAKKYMKENGNKTQWSDEGYPECLAIKDIENGTGYCLINQDNQISGVCTIIPGLDPTYSYIEGAWLDDDPYVVIHRIASRGIDKNIFNTIIEFTKTFNLDIRIDTHKDNKKMIELINQNGFKYCGIIYVLDNTPRLAYQLKKAQ